MTIKSINRVSILGLLLVLTLFPIRSTWAGLISTCTPQTCTWMISVDGNPVMNGMYTADADTGNITFGGTGTLTGDGYTVSLDSMDGNIDPLLGFGLGATNTNTVASAINKTFAFAFSLPLGGLTGPINTKAQLTTALTANTSAGGTVFATSGTGKIVDSQDITSSFISIDKGVDIGAGLSITGQGGAANIENATGFISSVGPFSTMSVIVAFGLTPQTSAGFTGFVEQTAVPVPAAVWLFGSGLIGLVGIARRKANI